MLSRNDFSATRRVILKGAGAVALIGLGNTAFGSLPALAEDRSLLGPGFRLSPRATGTDGFYIATLTRT